MKNKFPDDFLWGASTSAHQVEGYNFQNDWWQWEAAGGTAPSGKACDHYKRFKEDFSRAKKLGHNAHRFGLEWSRLEKVEGVWDQKEWDHYKAVTDQLLKLGIEPVVTLHHFTLPAWLSKKGGWLDPHTVNSFTRFASKAVEELGTRVRYWITINEPHILAFLGYYYGTWPPCEKNFQKALRVIQNTLIGHASAYSSMKEAANGIHKADQTKIGIAKAVTAFHPCSQFSVWDRSITHLRHKFHNHGFIRSAINGQIFMDGLEEKKLPAEKTLDFIGLNYYFRQFVRYVKPMSKHPFGEICPPSHHKEAGRITDMGWEIYPPGLSEVARTFSPYNLPIIITENGIATTDDKIRRQFIKAHLTQVLSAIKKGCPITGYLHWSLLDNFEWAEGFSKRFGLIDVDFATQKRSIRDSARYYSSIIKSGEIQD